MKQGLVRFSKNYRAFFLKAEDFERLNHGAGTAADSETGMLSLLFGLPVLVALV